MSAAMDGDPFDLDEAPAPDVIDLDAPTDGDEPDEPGKPTRREKRQARARDWQAEKDARIEALERKLEDATSSMPQRVVEQLRQQLQHEQQRQQPQGPNYDQQIAALDGYRDNLVRTFSAETAAKTMTEQRSQEIERQLKLIENRKSELQAEKVYARHAATQPRPYDPIEQEARQVTTEFSDIYKDQRALNMANGHYHMLLAEGASDGPETRRKALEFARRRMKGGRFDATEASMFRGQSAGGGGQVSKPVGNRIEMTAERKKAADAMYAHIRDPKERYTLWAKKCGRKALERERESRGGR